MFKRRIRNSKKAITFQHASYLFLCTPWHMVWIQEIDLTSDDFMTTSSLPTDGSVEEMPFVGQPGPPDLTPLDDVKRIVYQTPPASLIDLKKCIKEKSTKSWWRVVWSHFLNSCHASRCTEKGGKHVEKWSFFWSSWLHLNVNVSFRNCNEIPVTIDCKILIFKSQVLNF